MVCFPGRARLRYDHAVPVSTQHPDTRARRVRTRPASARPGWRPVLLAVVLVAAAALALLGADRTGGEVAAPVHDDDGDGVAGARDACPEAPGLEPDGCPPRDGDGDGVLDAADPCPAQAGPEVNRGCPDRDGDGDGVVDRRDRCPDQRGHAEAAGCVAPDGDGDAIRDAADACPDRAEVWNGRRDRDGCPDAGSAVLGVQPGRIELGQGRWFRRSGGLSSAGREAAPWLRHPGGCLREARQKPGGGVGGAPKSRRRATAEHRT
jgi:hypothetical protein